MGVERLGRIRVGDGAYARALLQEAIKEGISVMTIKATTTRSGVEVNEIISLSGPTDTWMTRLYQRGRIEVNVNNARAKGEPVIMSFNRFNDEI